MNPESPVPPSPRSEAYDAAAPVVLAEAPDSLVERIETRDGSLLRKTYTTSRGLLWRTLLRRSRSHREAANLQTLADSGIPVVEALDWSERRSLFCVVKSSLTTRFLPHAIDLRETLRSSACAVHRRACATRMGVLLRELHAAGLASTTLSPRNVLVSSRDEDVELRVCDQPFLTRLGRGGGRSWFQAIDLYDAFFSPNRLREWSSTERWRGILAYCAGDKRKARELWSKVSRRRRWTIRVARECTRLLSHVRSSDCKFERS